MTINKNHSLTEQDRLQYLHYLYFSAKTELCWWPILSSQSFHPFIRSPVSRSGSQSVRHSVNKSSGPSVRVNYPSVWLSYHQPIRPSVNRSVSLSVSHSVGRPVRLPTTPSVRPSVSQSVQCNIRKGFIWERQNISLHV